MKAAHIETQISFQGVKASAETMCLHYRLHSLQRTGILNVPWGTAAQRGERIMLLVILASVTQGLISAASG